MEQDDSVIVEEIQLSSISKASSYEEMGEFWDTHDLTDYWDQTYKVDFKVSKVLRHGCPWIAEMYHRSEPSLPPSSKGLDRSPRQKVVGRAAYAGRQTESDGARG